MKIIQEPALAPCLDLFYNVLEPKFGIPDRQKTVEASCTYLKQRLPLAWSHDPLITLKLIFNLDKTTYLQAFDTALLWIFHNHPKTWLSNLESYAMMSIHRYNLVYPVLTILLLGRDPDCCTHLEIEMAALDRYERDPNYRLLHDKVSDLLVQQLKSDVDKMMKLKQYSTNSDVDVHQYYISSTSKTCLGDHDVGSVYTTLLFRSIARKFFTPQGDSDSDSDSVLMERLTNEVLVPLKEVHEQQEEPPDEIAAVETYLGEVKATSLSGDKSNNIIAGDALLPHEIIHYVHHWSLGQAAELQWKAMVEHIYSKQKLRNCLVVCDANKKLMDRKAMETSIALGMLVSELSEEPWKGKVINYGWYADLQFIQGGDDVRYKCEFVRNMVITRYIDFELVYDRILQAAVDANLKPEQMVRKLFVLSHPEFRGDRVSESWNNCYGPIKRKYEEKGYGHVVPHMVFWSLSKYDLQTREMPRKEPGLLILNGFDDEIINLFLDNDGEITPDHLMELAISRKEYQPLTIVD